MGKCKGLDLNALELIDRLLLLQCAGTSCTALNSFLSMSYRLCAGTDVNQGKTHFSYPQT